MIDKQWQFLQDLAKLIEFAKSKNFVLVGGELYRTYEQQKIYYETGKSKTMNSRHLNRLAIDLMIMEFVENRWRISNDIEKYKVLGEYWKSLSPDNVWGGDWEFKDLVHFEKKP